MTRHQTRVMPQFVQPIATSTAWRSRMFGVFIAILTLLVVAGVYSVLDSNGIRRGETDSGLTTLIVSGVLCGGLAWWTFSIFRYGARASRLASRTENPDVKFIMETKRVGELGANGSVIPNTAIRITAEQFTELLSTPRPAFDGVAAASPEQLPRAIVVPRKGPA